MESTSSWAPCAIGTTLLVGVCSWLAVETSRSIHELPARAPRSSDPAERGPNLKVVLKDRNLLPLLAIQRASAERGGGAVDMESVLAKHVELEGDEALTAQAMGKKLDRLCWLGLARRNRKNGYVLTEDGRAWLASARRAGQIPDRQRGGDGSAP